MKKIFMFAIVLGAAMTFAACGSKENKACEGEEAAPAVEEAAPAVEEAIEAEDEAEAEELVIDEAALKEALEALEAEAAAE